MDGRILDLIMKENDAWDDLITRQKKEIPNLENMLSSIFESKKNKDEETKASVSLLKHELHAQEDNMSEIKMELAKQQQILANERNSISFSVHTLLSQNALRERIRNAERQFLDIKGNYFNYLASAM